MGTTVGLMMISFVVSGFGKTSGKVESKLCHVVHRGCRTAQKRQLIGLTLPYALSPQC